MSWERFDAGTFERRAGIPPDAAAAVARAVLDLVAPSPDDLVLELGAGTGEIGLQLARSATYLGLDRSPAMLDAFREKHPPAGARLLCTDADEAWPVAERSVRAVFVSRAAHLLDPDHLLTELKRTTTPGGYFLVGHVVRDQSGVRSVLRRRRAALLRERGLMPREGRAATGQLLDRLVATGSTRVRARSVASWQAEGSARQILEGWEQVPAIGGLELDLEVRSEILSRLARESGDLDRVTAWEERYMLEGTRLKEAPSTTRC